MKYHVYIYEVFKKYEVDLEAKTEEEASTKSFQLAVQSKNNLKEVENDCTYISFPYKKGD